MKNLLQNRLLFVAAMVFVAALTRLLPHPSNVAPIAAMSLFAGAYVSNRVLAFAIPMLALIVSDMLLGYFIYGMGLNPFYEGFYIVYACTAFVVVLGNFLKKNVSPARIAVYSITGSVVFFLVTNFAVWYGGTMYPQTMAGLNLCYTAALPYFQNSLFGDLFFNTIFFGSYYFVMQRKLVTA